MTYDKLKRVSIKTFGDMKRISKNRFHSFLFHQKYIFKLSNFMLCYFQNRLNTNTNQLASHSLKEVEQTKSMAEKIYF